MGTEIIKNKSTDYLVFEDKDQDTKLFAGIDHSDNAETINLVVNSDLVDEDGKYRFYLDVESAKELRDLIDKFIELNSKKR